MDYQAPPIEHVVVVNVDEVRNAYSRVVEAASEGKCCGNGHSCCGIDAVRDDAYAEQLGYTKEELDSVPEGANMGLGCGNPQAIAGLKSGEVVLDLGSGGGFDAFLAAKRVGSSGKVYGVDMTPKMIEVSRSLAKEYPNVEFLLGEIEHIPLPNSSCDVIISNCVVNLSNDKGQVFREAYRVLREGGRIAISDIVADKPLPKEMREDSDLFCNCISGAITISEIERLLAEAGFREVEVIADEESRILIEQWVPGSDAENYVVSAKIRAHK